MLVIPIFECLSVAPDAVRIMRTALETIDPVCDFWGVIMEQPSATKLFAALARGWHPYLIQKCGALGFKAHGLGAKLNDAVGWDVVHDTKRDIVSQHQLAENTRLLIDAERALNALVGGTGLTSDDQRNIADLTRASVDWYPGIIGNANPKYQRLYGGLSCMMAHYGSCVVDVSVGNKSGYETPLSAAIGGAYGRPRIIPIVYASLPHIPGGQKYWDIRTELHYAIARLKEAGYSRVYVHLGWSRLQELCEAYAEWMA